MSNVTTVVLAHSPVQIEITCVDDHDTHFPWYQAKSIEFNEWFSVKQFSKHCPNVLEAPMDLGHTLNSVTDLLNERPSKMGRKQSTVLTWSACNSFKLLLCFKILPNISLSIQHKLQLLRQNFFKDFVLHSAL